MSETAGTGSVDRPRATPYPVVLEGRLDPELSRGLWLVKWLLALPHVIVLAVLWVAFVLATIVAGLAILATGRYPRGIFEFNVGVLRWSWRVSFYAYGVLGTDRYPAFTLAPDPDDAVRFDVAYPGELSRGLVLVKWWLLALPHLLIVGVLTGGAAWTWELGGEGGAEAVANGGILGVLAFLAGLLLLVRGSYPRGLFDLIMGLQRWVYRVAAYVALMTDAYPPFRLDSGGEEPEVGAAPRGDGPPPSQTGAPEAVPG